MSFTNVEAPEITARMKRSYYRIRAINALIFVVFSTIGWALINQVLPVPPLFSPEWQLSLSVLVSLIAWNIMALWLHARVVLRLIWRHTVCINKNQYAFFGGKCDIAPPEKFTDVWKYQGELDFDYVLATEYNGIVIHGWFTTESYIVRFWKKEAAVYFKMCVPPV